MERIIASNLDSASAYLDMLNKNGLQAYTKSVGRYESSREDIFLVYDTEEELKKAVDIVELVDARHYEEYFIKCPLCGEDIPKKGTRCGYCDAKKKGNTWQPPKTRPHHLSRFHIRLLAVFFLACAFMVGLLMLPQNPLPLLISVFLALGIGIWLLK